MTMRWYGQQAFFPTPVAQQAFLRRMDEYGFVVSRAHVTRAAFEDAEAAGSAAIAVAGKLVDYPIYESARRLLLDARRSAAENLA